FLDDTQMKVSWPLHLRDWPPPLVERASSRHRSRRAKTPPPAHPAFRTHRPASLAAASAIPASDNARHVKADRTAHTALDTIVAPGESARDRPTHADVVASVDWADRRHRTPPIRRPPAFPPADGELDRVPGSGPCSRPAPGPIAANPFHPRPPAPELRRT